MITWGENKTKEELLVMYEELEDEFAQTVQKHEDELLAKNAEIKRLHGVIREIQKEA